jgi:hypothetical protein
MEEHVCEAGENGRNKGGIDGGEGRGGKNCEPHYPFPRCEDAATKEEGDHGVATWLLRLRFFILSVIWE